MRGQGGVGWWYAKVVGSGGAFGAPEPGQLRRRGLYGRVGVSSRLRRAGGARWADEGCAV